MWRLGRVEELLPSSDGEVRGVLVRVMSKRGQVKMIRRPIQHIYPLEVRNEPSEPTVANTPSTPETAPTTVTDSVRPRSTRRAAVQARDSCNT